MSIRYSAALLALGILIAPALADKRKADNAPETAGPPPRVVSQTPPAVVYERQTVLGEKSEELVKTYSVGDLVFTIPMAGAPLGSVAKTHESELIASITSKVQPAAWASKGGTATIEYFPLTLSLVVNATQPVQDELVAFLDNLRKMQDHKVVTHVKFVTISDAHYKSLGLAKRFSVDCCDEGKTCEKKFAVKTLKAVEVEKFLTAAQIDEKTDISQCPKLTHMNGQPSSMTVGDTQHFVTGVNVQTVEGRLSFTPKEVHEFVGIDLNAEPTVSADGKYVSVALNCVRRELGITPTPMLPLMTTFRPENEDGTLGKEMPFTQLLHAPKFVSRGVKETVTIADGGTALMYAGKATIEATRRESMPMLADVPVLAQLFSREVKETTTNHLLVMVTTEIIKPEGGSEESEACPACEGKLSIAMADYHKACKAGQTDAARRLAMECLVIDPTCFGKK